MESSFLEGQQSNYDIMRQSQGLSSLIAKVQIQHNLSSVVNRDQKYFNMRIKNISELSSQFIWRANMGDLWRILRKYLNQKIEISALFSDPQSKKILQATCLLAKYQIHHKLYLQYKEQYPEEGYSISKLQQILKRTHKNSNFKSAKFYKETLLPKLVAQFQVSQDQIIKSLQEFDYAGLRKDILNQLYKFVLLEIYITIRKSNQHKTQNAYIIYLIIYYLRIHIENKSLYHLIHSKFNIAQLQMRFLAQPNGINRILRFFEDILEVEIFKKEYEFTKSTLVKKH